MAEETVAVFIDGSNLYRALQANKGRHDLNFEAFTKKLVGKRKLLRTYYYNATVDQFVNVTRYTEQQKFFAALYRVQYLEVRLGRVIAHEKDGKIIEVEKGVDVKLTVDMLRLAWSDAYDTAILAAHDGDYADAVLAVKDVGKHVEIACFTDRRASQRVSHQLVQVSDRLIALDGNFLAHV